MEVKVSRISLSCLVAQSCPTLCDPMNWSPPGCSVCGDSSGKNTGVGCYVFLQGIFPTQRLKSDLLHWQAGSLPLHHLGMIAQMVKNPPQFRRPWFNSWVGKIPWRRDRLPTPVFFVFPCDSAGKESTCNVGDLNLIPGLGRSSGEGKGLPTPVFWPRDFHGLYSP